MTGGGVHVASASFGGRLTTGPAASPSRLPGISVGHASAADTGVTVVACPEGAVAAVDVADVVGAVLADGEGTGDQDSKNDAHCPTSCISRAYSASIMVSMRSPIVTPYIPAKTLI